MVNVDDILKSMLDEMKKYQQEYDAVTIQVNNIIKEYTAKIDDLQKQRLALQDEGNKKIDILNAKREQLSGKHSSLYEQYKKFAGKEPDFTTDATIDDKAEKTVTKKTIKKLETNPKVETSIENKSAKNEVEITSNTLSKEEIAKLSEITGEEKSVVDKNGNEIPEYLQNSYKK